jgi:hypothetical protein
VNAATGSRPPRHAWRGPPALALALALAALPVRRGGGDEGGQPPVPPPVPEVVVTGPDTIELRWPGVPGWVYFVQSSPDLAAWAYEPLVFAGTDYGPGHAAHALESDTRAGRRFFRLRRTERPGEDPWAADFDGDGLANGLELLVGYDPLAADSRGDGHGDGERASGAHGIPDWCLLLHFGDLAVDPGRILPNGLSVAQTHALGLDPLAADFDGDGLRDSEDADPRDRAVDWPPVAESRFAWVPLEGWDAASHGQPLGINNKGQVLFENALWQRGEWLEINRGPHAYPPPGFQSPAPDTINATPEAIDERGGILGWGSGGDSAGGDFAGPVYWPEPSARPLALAYDLLAVEGGWDFAGLPGFLPFSSPFAADGRILVGSWQPGHGLWFDPALPEAGPVGTVAGTGWDWIAGSSRSGAVLGCVAAVPPDPPVCRVALAGGGLLDLPGWQLAEIEDSPSGRPLVAGYQSRPGAPGSWPTATMAPGGKSNRSRAPPCCASPAAG